MAEDSKSDADIKDYQELLSTRLSLEETLEKIFDEPSPFVIIDIEEPEHRGITKVTKVTTWPNG